MSHIVITRMLYEDNDPRFEDRLALYKTLCLPRLERQTDKEFNVAVLCNKSHRNIFAKLGIIPFHLKDNWFGRVGKIGWSAFTPWENVKGLDKYDIQSNLDSDDLVSENYIERIKKVAVGDNSLHIHFQPRLFNLHTFEEKEQKKKYNEECGSAFYSLYQPDKKKYIYVGHDSHIRMGQYMDKSILIGEGYCWINIHGSNDSTTMNS
jgi:hypothetical protein